MLSRGRGFEMIKYGIFDQMKICFLFHLSKLFFKLTTIPREKIQNWWFFIELNFLTSFLIWFFVQLQGLGNSRISERIRATLRINGNSLVGTILFISLNFMRIMLFFEAKDLIVVNKSVGIYANLNLLIYFTLM